MRSELRFCALALLAALPAAAPQDKVAPREFEARIRPLLETYCISCHGPKKQKAKVDLSLARSEGDLARNPDLWLRVLHQIKSRALSCGAAAPANSPIRAQSPSSLLTLLIRFRF